MIYYKYMVNYSLLRKSRAEKIREQIRPSANLSVSIPEEYRSISQYDFCQRLKVMEADGFIRLLEFAEIAGSGNVIGFNDGVFQIKEELYSRPSTPVNPELKRLIDEITWNSSTEINATENVSYMAKQFTMPEHQFQSMELAELLKKADSMFAAVLKCDADNFYTAFSMGFSNIKSDPVFGFFSGSQPYSQIFSQRRALIIYSYPELLPELWNNVPDINIRNLTSCCFLPVDRERQMYLFFTFDRTKFHSDDIITIFKLINNLK